MPSGDKYLDGMRVAAEPGIELEPRVPPLPNLRVDWRLAKMAGTDKDMQEARRSGEALHG